MRKFYAYAWRAAAALLLVSFSAACGRARDRVASVATPAVTGRISRTLLEHYDLPQMPGWESRLYLIEYGPGVSAPVHHHPVRGLGYVLNGRFESAFGSEPPALVRAGQSFIEREDLPHNLFRNPDLINPLRFVISFVVRTGAPVVETP
jgi:quercetin dioxygenase-like cupin family protein